MHVVRREFKLFGNVLLEPERASRQSIVIDAEARDPGNPPDTTILRAGLILGIHRTSGKALPFGRNFTARINVTVATGDGTLREFQLPHQNLVPFSETVRIGGVVQTRGIHYYIHYPRGRLYFYAAPASGAVISADYLNDEVRDGTEIPAGVLEDFAYLRDDIGAPRDTPEVMVIAGHVREAELKAPFGGLDFALAYLSKHGFLGIRDPEYRI